MPYQKPAKIAKNRLLYESRRGMLFAEMDDVLKERLLTRLVIARKAAQLSQTELETRMGLPGGSVSKFESGSRGISSSELALLARLTGRTMDWFFQDGERDLAVQFRGEFVTNPHEDLGWMSDLVDTLVAIHTTREATT